MYADTRCDLVWGNQNYPHDGRDIWGARWIFPDDFLSDRSSYIMKGKFKDSEVTKWLNGDTKPIYLARQEARKLADAYLITKTEDRNFILYEDNRGIFIANPQASYGYLYVCSYLKKEGDVCEFKKIEIQPPYREPKLSDWDLCFLEGGRIACGKLECARETARYIKKTLDGLKVVRVTKK